LAGIGPSIGPHHYEVGPEVIHAVQAAFGQDAAGLLQPSNHRHAHEYPAPAASPGQPRSDGLQDTRPTVVSDAEERKLFDLWNANRLLLARAGVRQVEIAGVCTACGLEDWYSHRAEKGRTGRFGALIAL